MDTVTNHIRNRLLAGTVRIPPLEQLQKTEWSQEFETLMRNRLIMGSFRYGLLHKKSVTFDRVGSAILRLERYNRDGNREHLVDVANMMLLEFEEGGHVGKQMIAQDDSEHTQHKEAKQ